MTTIRMATPADCQDLLHIYGQYIDTVITFDCQLPTEQEFQKRYEETATEYPVLVSVEDGRITGYASAHPYKDKEAYQWGAELSIYLDPAFTGKGIGDKLYEALLNVLKIQGIRTVYGCVTSPNPRSERLHDAFGFRLVGRFHSAGYKNGAWHDVMWFEKQIAPYDEAPQPFQPITEIPREIIEGLI